jgi:hypothetical protein
MRFFFRINLISLLLLTFFTVHRANLAFAGDDLSMPEGSAITEPTDEPTPTGVVYLGVGLGFYKSDFATTYGGSIIGYGVNAGFLSQFGQSGLYWGGDFGIYFWGINADSTIASNIRGAVSVHMLPSLVYRFSPLPGVSLRPFFGVSVGPNLYVFKNTQAGPGAGQVTDSGSTNFYFEILARPGIDWEFSQTFRLSAEMKVGVLNWGLIFMPQGNFSINL